jgi:release factor glutamine methyltransferase
VNTIAETLKQASTTLRANDIANDLLDAQTLLAYALNCDRTHLIVNYQQSLTDEQLTNYQSLLARRAAGEPLQYITERQEFFGLEFRVTPAVLIPRPETELLVEEAIRLAQTLDHAPIIVDAGTGSGCIAISLARELESVQLYATDISPDALAIARQNAASNNVAERIEFIQCDLLTGLPDVLQADFIVSNPPYIAAEEMAMLQREIREWEPHSALTDNADGLSFYRCLLAEAPLYLRANGYFLCELGYQQSEIVMAMVKKGWSNPYLLNDLQGIPRTLVTQKTTSG